MLAFLKKQHDPVTLNIIADKRLKRFLRPTERRKKNIEWSVILRRLVICLATRLDWSPAVCGRMPIKGWDRVLHFPGSQARMEITGMSRDSL